MVHFPIPAKILVVAAGLVLVVAAAAWMLTQRSTQPTVEQQPDNSFSRADVAKHYTVDDCWTIIEESVYNLTDYVKRHPGGEEILRACGEDATELFASRTTEDGQAVGSAAPHSESAQRQLEQLKIGRLE